MTQATAESSATEPVESSDVSPFYRHAARLPFASRISLQVRKGTFDHFMRTMAPLQSDLIVDIGVTCDARHSESNFFEKFYPFKNRITCVGVEDGSFLEKEYPGVSFCKVSGADPLPFADGAFDIAFSNAVVEHVGNAAHQRFFLAEACRVAKRVFITTPNRWFPVEHHTGVPLLHYLPKSTYRALLKHTPLSYWSDEANLNALTKEELEGLFPRGAGIKVERVGIGFGPFKSNLVAYTSL